MPNINPDKTTFPDTTAEVAAMLNMSESTLENSPVTHHEAAPSNLPIIDAISTPVTDEPLSPETAAAAARQTRPDNFAASEHIPSEPAGHSEEPGEEAPHQPLELENEKNSKARAFRIAKSVVPYVAVFLVGLFIYQYFFSSFSVANFLSNSSSNQVASQSQNNQRMADLKKQQAAAYATWIQQFFYDVSDASVIDMDNDLSGNGLTNFEKFLFNLNPKAYDTLGLGQPDGQTILNGVNPWTGKALTDNQKAIVDNYLDRQIISDRLAAGSLKLSQGGIANALTAPGSGGYQNPGNYSFIDGSGTSASGQVAGASTTVPRSASGATGSDSLMSLDIDESQPGRLDIPGYKISVPLIFTSDTKNFDADLHKGVVHYPGTALPSQAGTAYISGHSSGYVWDKNPYKNVFRGLGNIKDGTSFTITVTVKDGRKATIHYVVDGRKEYQANDQTQFLQTPDPRVALSTCWPVDTSARRLVLFGRQTQVGF